MPSPKILGRDELARKLGFDTLPSSVQSPSIERDRSETPVGDDAKAPANVPTRRQDEPPSVLATIQTQYALINLNGALWVLDRRRLDAPCNQGMAAQLALSNFSHGGLLIRRAVKEQFPQADARTVADSFFQSPGTTCYQGVEFNPRETTPGWLNLWVGPTIVPAAGDCKAIKRFLFEIVCRRDPAAYMYLMNYMAHALQRPWEKPGVMIILIGGQGTGKGTFGRILQRIWGASYVQVTNIDHVTGTFNGALERSFIVFMDEALFAGNRSASDRLKSLVTEPVVLINEKHQPTRQITSHHRFVAATNASHLKHTERDDRRDFTLRLSDERKGDFAYWKPLHEDIDGEGLDALVYELLQRDLSEFNVRAKPSTPELIEQKLMSLDAIERWWFDSLQNGTIGESGVWPSFIPTTEALEGVFTTPGTRLYKRPIGRELVRAIKPLAPSVRLDQRRVEGHRQRGLVLPSLEVARAEFETWIGGSIDW
jgi:hypothetical protein